MRSSPFTLACKVMIKRIMTLAVVFGSLMSMSCKSRSAPASGDSISPPTSNGSVLFLDNIAYKEDGEEFANAFAQEPSCTGLSLMLWTNHTHEERMRGMKARWWVSYAHVESGGTAFVGVDRKDKEGASLRMIDGARTPTEAAQWVCSIVKKKGGKDGEVQ